MSSAETWLPVVGYEGYYEVSNQGRVRGRTRIITDRSGAEKRIGGRVMSLNVSRTGYQTVALSRDGRAKTRFVHHLVLTAFVSDRPSGTEACHNDGNPAHNSVDNLRWDTHRSNMQDVLAHGTHEKQQRTACPRGHGLHKGNLIASELRKGHRACLACNRARGFASTRRIPFTNELADAYYAQSLS